METAKQPGQFGILALVVLTTAVAIAAAVVRMPVDPMLKMCVVFAIAICFYGWAMRNWKYADPRQQSLTPVSPLRRRTSLVVGALSWTIYVVVMLYSQVYRASGAGMGTWLGVLVVACLVMMVAIQVWRVVREW